MSMTVLLMMTRPVMGMNEGHKPATRNPEDCAVVATSQFQVGDLCFIKRQEADKDGYGNLIWTIRHNVPRVLQVQSCDKDGVMVSPIDNKESFTHTFSRGFDFNSLRTMPASSCGMGCVVLQLQRLTDKRCGVGGNMIKNIDGFIDVGYKWRHDKIMTRLAQLTKGDRETITITFWRLREPFRVKSTYLQPLEPKDLERKEWEYITEEGITTDDGDEGIRRTFRNKMKDQLSYLHVYGVRYPVNSKLEYEGKMYVVKKWDAENYTLRLADEPNADTITVPLNSRSIKQYGQGWSICLKPDDEVDKFFEEVESNVRRILEEMEKWNQIIAKKVKEVEDIQKEIAEIMWRNYSKNYIIYPTEDLLKINTLRAKMKHLHKAIAQDRLKLRLCGENSTE